MKKLLGVLFVLLAIVELHLFFALNSLPENQPLATVSPTFYAKSAHPIEDTVHIITPVVLEDGE